MRSDNIIARAPLMVSASRACCSFKPWRMRNEPVLAEALGLLRALIGLNARERAGVHQFLDDIVGGGVAEEAVDEHRTHDRDGFCLGQHVCDGYASWA